MAKTLKWNVVCKTDKHNNFNPTLIVEAQSDCEARSKAIVRLYNNGCSEIEIVSCTKQKRGRFIYDEEET